MDTKLKLYQVEVKRQGTTIASFTLPAVTALEAIEQVERYYGDPASIEYVTIEDGHGHQHDVMLIHHWHGYMFHAKVIDPKPTSIKDQAAFLSEIGMVMPV